MNSEAKTRNNDKKHESTSFFIDISKKECGSIDKDDSIAAGEAMRSKAGHLDIEIEAKRPGPRSSAQTPSLPSEKKKGSEKNKPGSAGEKSSDAISFSKKVIEALKNKVREHNSKHSRKVSLSQLKKVYRRGAGAFSSSHRPGKTRGQWAMARVNMFLRMMSGGKVKDAYRKADQDVAKSSLDTIDISNLWEPGEEDLAQASLDIQEIGDFEFDSVDELYLDEDSTAEKWYEI
jgi:hypothetical protein